MSRTINMDSNALPGLVPLALVLDIFSFHSSTTELSVALPLLWASASIYLYFLNAPPTHRNTQTTGTLPVKHQLPVSMLSLPSGILPLLVWRLGYVTFITLYWRSYVVFTIFPLLCAPSFLHLVQLYCHRSVCVCHMNGHQVYVS